MYIIGCSDFILRVIIIFLGRYRVYCCGVFIISFYNSQHRHLRYFDGTRWRTGVYPVSHQAHLSKTPRSRHRRNKRVSFVSFAYFLQPRFWPSPNLFLSPFILL